MERRIRGAYYTPDHVVDYIVGQTLAVLLADKCPDEIGRLRILDPSCGDGAFLLGAYRFLVEWHRVWYVGHDSQRMADGPSSRLMRDSTGQWQLTTGEKQRIAQCHIFGLDIDRQAVQAARQAVEAAAGDGASVGRFDDNIRQGNALVGPDCPEGEELCPFDWLDPKAGFGGILATGGFDIVVGNPPYLDAECMANHWKGMRDYCSARYRAATGNWDLFCVFLEKAFEVCRPGGRVSYVVPNKLASADYAAVARRILVGENRLLTVRDYSEAHVFPVAVYPLVFVAAKEPPESTHRVQLERMARGADGECRCIELREVVCAGHFGSSGEPWRTALTAQDVGTLETMERFPTLASWVEVRGAATVAEAYAFREFVTEADAGELPATTVVNSGTVDRYRSRWGIKPLRYLGRSLKRPILSARHLEQLPEARRRQTLSAKIIVAGMTRRLECLGDFHGRIMAGKSTSIILLDQKESGPSDLAPPRMRKLAYLLGVLNSRALSFYFARIFDGNRLRGGYFRVGPPQLRRLPIPSWDGPAAKPQAGQISDLVLRYLALIDASLTINPRETVDTTTQIALLEQQIDTAVYSLYGLSAAQSAAIDACFATGRALVG